MDVQDEDYLTTAGPTFPSFHFRVGKAAVLPEQVAPKAPTSAFGYPQPGPQSPSPIFATAKHYFVDDTTWNNILDHGEFDDVVIGSGFCALAYVDRALELNPFRKILILERGGFWLPEHFQNLPLPFKLVLGGPSETFPFQLTSKTVDSTAKFVHGSCPFFGGRSTFWSAWCPRPSIELMRDFPPSLIKTSEGKDFWKNAEDLLNVTKADKINSPVFGQKLQRDIYERLHKAVSEKKIDTAEYIDHAPLAVGRKTSIPGDIAFDKFSTPGPLLAIHDRQRRLHKDGKGNPLMIATDTVAIRFETDPEDDKNRPTVLHTSRGALCFPKANTNVILACGVFPATTFLMNSIPKQIKDCAGSRASGHVLTHIAARFPITEESGKDGFTSHLEIGAHYLAGRDREKRLQYHVQITAIHSPHPETDAEDAGRLCPDYAAAATMEQLKDSERYVVLVCATLGELDEKYDHSWVRPNPSDPDPTTNIRVQMLPNEKVNELWNLMDQVTYDAIKVMADKQADKVEYWHDAVNKRESRSPTHDVIVPKTPGRWLKDKPTTGMIRVPGIVHETATLYMSDDLKADPHASVDSEYRPRNCENVFVTGGALFPSSGSWNPTLTMCGFAQDLATKLKDKVNTSQS